MSSPADVMDRFVEHLETRVRSRDRGALAALRRGLGKPPGAAPEMHRYVVPWIPTGSSGFQASRWYLVASLFALWHQGREDVVQWRGGLGSSFRQLANAEVAAGVAPAGPGGPQDPAIAKRFVALLASHPDDLPEHLRHGVSLLRSGGVGVDWAQLLRDLGWWDSDDRFVQQRWAREFWARAAPLADSPQAPHGGHEAGEGDEDAR